MLGFDLKMANANSEGEPTLKQHHSTCCVHLGVTINRLEVLSREIHNVYVAYKCMFIEPCIARSL